LSGVNSHVVYINTVNIWCYCWRSYNVKVTTQTG